MKWFIIAVGGIVSVAHIGILGHLIKPQQSIHSSPTINLPKGPYSSYKIKLTMIFTYIGHSISIRFQGVNLSRKFL